MELENKSVKEVLETILDGTGLGYVQVDNNIIINDKPVTKNKSAKTSTQPSTSQAIVKEISGFVKDSQGSGIPGANILIKGSTLGTTTDAEENIC